MTPVAVLIDFENLVLGAEESLPSTTDPVPYAAIELLWRHYGNAVVRRAYADWARPRFNRFQDGLSLNGVDLVHVTRFGAKQNNAIEMRVAIDAMELVFTRPDVGVFIIVAGDGDYTPLAQRLREFGKQVVGVGTEASASRRLVSVCSEYKYWPTLVSQVDPQARPAVAAEFHLDTAEGLLVKAVQATSQPVLATLLRGRMLAIDPSFDERNYGCRSFRDFLGRMSHVVVTERKEYDLAVSLPTTPRTDGLNTSVRAAVAQEHTEPLTPALLAELRALGADLPVRPDTREALLERVHHAWREDRLQRLSDIDDVLLAVKTAGPPNKATRLHLRMALVCVDPPVVPLAERPVPDSRPLRQCAVTPYDGSASDEWTQRAHVAWLAWTLYRLGKSDSLDSAMVSTFFADAVNRGAELVAAARRELGRKHKSTYHCQAKP